MTSSNIPPPAKENSSTNAQVQQLLQNYQHNYARHLLALSRHFRSRLMHHLQSDCGFTTLRLGWEPLLSLPGKNGITVGLLAEELGISKQNCDQQLRSIESKGYVQRINSPYDKRSRLVVLSETGTQVIKAGIKQAALYEKEILQEIGEKQYALTSHALQSLCTALQLPQYRSEHNSKALIPALIRLASYAQKRLMELTIIQGHPGLQLSYGQVLNHIGLQGVGIQELAEINEVTKQAIVRIANQLEDLDYIRRIKHPQIPRSKLIVLTDKGLLLLEDASEALAQLKQEWLTQIEPNVFDIIEKNLAKLYRQTAPKDFSNDNQGLINIHQLEKSSTTENISLSQLLMALAYQLDNNSSAITHQQAEGYWHFSENTLKSLENAKIKNKQIEMIIVNRLGTQKTQQLFRLLGKLI